MNSDRTPAIPAIRQVGVIGGGQLAWMMVEAAQSLGLEIVVQTPRATDPALNNSLRAETAFAIKAVLAPIGDAEATARLAQQCQVVTFENEFVDLDALRHLEAQGVCFRPGLSVLAALLDKYEQHQFLESLGVPVPAFATITPQTDLAALGFSFPVVIKSRRHGYDGQGTFMVRDAAELAQFWQGFAGDADTTHRFMVEAFVPFERELAVMAARSATGEIALYPVVETYQKQQVCRWAIAPVALPPQTQTQIQTIATRLLESLDAIGILGIELFLTPDGRVVVNEIAPRTHNSGHLTIDACKTSQFEQHLRAVCGLPLGDPSLHAAGAVMVNLLGYETAMSDYLEQRQHLAAVPNATVHWYGKTDAKLGRKLGHATVLLNTSEREQAIAMARQIEALWYPNP
ncbi:5-(carboxyamino)imidazole ribonucleotide synthase [Altericista sp. CCNU0014]|uniref:5-(carboxyamino)imidazole ribonucleotide synthase n=1 Tax=Altericista sp. CCNU0014 TaxID=3082949 RepID=UPI00384E5201